MLCVFFNCFIVCHVSGVGVFSSKALSTSSRCVMQLEVFFILILLLPPTLFFCLSALWNHHYSNSLSLFPTPFFCYNYHGVFNSNISINMTEFWWPISILNLPCTCMVPILSNLLFVFLLLIIGTQVIFCCSKTHWLIGLPLQCVILNNQWHL
jgi:hypothetical protein